MGIDVDNEVLMYKSCSIKMGADFSKPDGEQILAMIKKFRLMVECHDELGTWYVSYYGKGRASGFDKSLNLAVCKCVARIPN